MSALNDGGPFTMMIMGLGGLGILVVLALTGLGITRRRVPLTLWLLMPLAVIMTGAIGSWLGAGEALAALAGASSDALADMANRGYGEALAPDVASRWIGAGLLVLAAWGAGLGAVLRGDDEMVPTWFAGVSAILVSLVGGGAVAAFAVAKGLGAEGFALAGLLAFGGVGVGIGAFRRAIYDSAFRVAGMRFASGMALVFAVAWAGRALVVGASSELHSALASASSAMYATTLTEGVAHAGALGTAAWLALGFAVAVALIGFVGELGEVVQKGTLLDVCGVIVLLLAMFGVRALENGRIGTLKDVGDLEPLAAMVSELNYELPGAGVPFEDATVDARPRDGGFGDVVLFTEDDGWVRRYRWNGAGWDHDETALEQAQISSGPTPLLVASGDVLATDVLSALEAVGGEGLMLMRINELDSEASSEAKARQGTLLPIRLAEEPDLSQDLWGFADLRGLFQGPVLWYGEGDEEKKVFTRVYSAFQDTEAAGLNLVVGERARARDIVDFCLPALVQANDDGVLVGAEGRYCALTQGDMYETIEVAAETWEAPEAEHVSLWHRAGRGLDSERAATVLEREIGAFDYCASKVEVPELEEGAEAPEPEPVTGRLQLEVQVASTGQVTGLIESARTQITERGVIDCVRRRIAPLRFSEHESEEPIGIDLVLTYR